MIKCQSCKDNRKPGPVPMVPREAQCGHMAPTGGYKYCKSCAEQMDCCSVCGLLFNPLL